MTFDNLGAGVSGGDRPHLLRVRKSKDAGFGVQKFSFALSQGPTLGRPGISHTKFGVIADRQNSISSYTLVDANSTSSGARCALFPSNLMQCSVN